MANRPLFVLGFSSFFCLFFLCSIPKNNLAWLAFAFFILAALLSLFFIKKSKNKELCSIFLSMFIALSGFCLLFIAQTKLIYEPVINMDFSAKSIEGVLISTEQESNGKFYYTIKTKSIGDKQVKTKLRFLSNSKLELEPMTNLKIETKKIYQLGETDSVWHTAKKADGIYIGAYGDIIEAKSNGRKTPLYYVLKLQGKIKSIITSTIPSQEGGILLGLMLGDTGKINDSSYFLFKSSGVTHLFSVSGLHVSLWSLFLANILKNIGLPSKFRAIICIGFLIFIVALTGFTPSAIRAGIIMAVLFLSNIISKDSDSLNSLGLAMLILLMINPFAARSLSLILSFFAALGILVFAKGFENIFKRLIPQAKNIKIKAINNFVISSLSISFSVILTTLPWMAYFFRSFSLISPIANIFIVLPASCAMILTGASLLVFPIKFFFYPLISIAALISKYILAITKLFSQIPFAQLRIEPFLFYASIILGLVFALFYFAKFKSSKNKSRHILVFFSLILIFSNLTYSLTPSKTVKIIIPDNGNNSGIIIMQGNKSAMLACGGSFNSLSFCLSSNNIDSLDFLAVPRSNVSESLAYDSIINRYVPKNMLCCNDFLSKINGHENDSIVSADTCNISILNDVGLEYKNQDDFSAIKLRINETSLIICFFPFSNFDDMPEDWHCADVLVCRAAIPKSLNPQNFKHIIINTNKDIKTPSHKSLKTTNIFGEISLTIKAEGEISL